ncbi:MAG: hypothetical protein K6B52_00400 [Clostridiales bacterium]|nr:hypothetical protein [Clostridiales bacterium]
MKKSTINAIVFAVAAVILLPFRIVQYFTNIEPQTGFYTGFSVSIVLFGFLVAAFGLYFIIDAFSDRRSLQLTKNRKKNPGMGIMALAVAATTVHDAAGIFNYDGSSSVTAESQVNVRFLFYLQGIFALLTAVYFILSAVDFFSGRGSGGRYRIFALSPVLWNIFRLTARFTKAISYARVSELFLNMLMVAFFIAFFMNYAQADCNINRDGCDYKVKSAGYCASLLALITFLPCICLHLAGKDHMLYADKMFEFSDITIALFILGTVITRVEKVENDFEEVIAVAEE